MRIKPLHVVLGLGAALGGYFWATHNTFKTAGEAAKVGDDVQIPVTSLPPGSLGSGIPSGAGFAIIRVGALDAGSVQGFVTAFQVQSNMAPVALPIPVGPVNVNRALITGVTRGGKLIA